MQCCAEKPGKTKPADDVAGWVFSPSQGALVFGSGVDKVPTMPVSELTDAMLMERTRLGDRKAFEELVNRYRRPILRLARRTVRDDFEAEDLAQKVFVQAYRAAGRYRPTAKFSTWLFTIARNLCLNEIRRRIRRSAESLDAWRDSEEGAFSRQFEDPAGQEPDQEVQRAELYQMVEEAIDDLPENQRVAITLCREGDQSYEDIGEVLGLSVSAVKSLVFRAREALKRRLKPYLRSGEWGARAVVGRGSLP
jgi:RNA polymerase sigma-70 factor (ECF subfamily)